MRTMKDKNAMMIFVRDENGIVGAISKLKLENDKERNMVMSYIQLAKNPDKGLHFKTEFAARMYITFLISTYNTGDNGEKLEFGLCDYAWLEEKYKEHLKERRKKKND